MAMALSRSTPANTIKVGKKKILEAVEYDKICDFIHLYDGITIDCELELYNNFNYVDRKTLKSILQTEWSSLLRSQHWRYESLAQKHLKLFQDQTKKNDDPTILIKLAVAERMTPVSLCRSILQEKYKFENKSDLSRLLKYPHLIDDPILCANVMQCICSDIQEGPLVDLRRRIIGEEYEFKLKELARNAGMHYYTEHDLRRLGYDKTPDLKMILPFLYKGEQVNWIESKAGFGDVKTHKWNIRQQLNSYSNRFGAGIVIYWFGYHNELPDLSENKDGIIVLDDFPEVQHITLLNLEQESDTACVLDVNDNSTAEFL
ncbi:CDAN1-interacting nuclease 1-like [Teleopsis dalmanni]|uniref:CDAN1-interacting nuclease 1-like n=1 Tax=Teleopsis dalmanni TaxID=139649 RepID=UPI0018CD795B|nr:CDAN1-interacting nuclease 1-like [Teleopsis dalmanni]